MTVTLASLTESAFPAYRQFLDGLFADQTHAAYQAVGMPVTADLCSSFAKQTLDTLLPAGFHTPGALFYDINTQHGTVGNIWLARQPDMGCDTAFLRYIHIAPQHQRQGYATSALKALFEEARNLGISHLHLNVYGFNQQAIALYSQLGFVPFKMQMTKDL